MIVLNLKAYKESFERIGEIANAAKEVNKDSGVRIVLCPPDLLLTEYGRGYAQVFAQHCDENSFGAYTGSSPAEGMKLLGIHGSLVNHSEKRIPIEKIKNTVSVLNKLGMESIVCAESPKEVFEISKFNPSFIAIEPKELIGSGISVSNARPGIVTDSLDALRKANSKVPLLCGAGVSNKEDTKKALELGVEGVLLASAFVKAKDHRRFLEELAGVF